MTMLYLGSTDGFPVQREVKDGQVFPVDQQQVWQKVEPAWSGFEFSQEVHMVGSPVETVTQTIKKTKAEGKVSARGKHKTLQGSCGQQIPAGKALLDSETHP